MKKSLILMLVATSAFFFACGDDSSSDSSTGANGGKATVKVSGSITVDNENKTVLVTIPNTHEVCVNEDAGVYKWKKVNFEADSTYSKYLFVGDTLVMLDCEYVNEDGEPEDCDEKGQMMVGGKAGNLNGTWKAIPCMYDIEDSVSTCLKPCSEVPGGKLTDEEMEEAFTERRSLEEGEDLVSAMLKPKKIDESLYDRMTCLTPEELSKRGFNESTVTISGNSISSVVTHYYDDGKEEDFDDYMNSEFMSKFYRNLSNGGRPDLPGFGNLDDKDSAGVKKYKEAAGVEVLKQTKNSISFKFLGQKFSMTVKGYVRAIDKSVTSFVIEYNGAKCDYQEEYGDVTKSTCNSKYGEFFDKDTRTDADGNEIMMAYAYEKSNRVAFDNCVDDIMDSVYAVIKKNGGDIGDDDDNCGEIIQEYYVCSAAGSISNCNYMGYQECLAALTDEDEMVSSFPKKALSSREQTEKEFFKVFRKFFRKVEKLAE